MGNGEDNKAGKISLMPMATVSVQFGDVQVVLDGIKAEDPTLRFTASQALCHPFGKQKLTSALKPLVGLLGDPTYFVRWSAALALGELGDPRAVKPLVGRLGDGNFCVKIAAANSLGKLGHPYAVEPLIGSLDPTKEQHTHVRAAVARALGAIRDERALPHLLKSLKNEEFAVVISAISGALGEFDDNAVVEPLIRSLDTMSININAAISLGKLRNSVTDKQVTEMLYFMKNGSNYQHRTGCALAIGEIGRDGTSYYLKEAAESDSSMAVRWAVAKVMHKTGNQAEALKLLLGLLKQDETAVSEAALESVIELLSNVSSTRDLLSSAVIELDDSVRVSAAIEAADSYLRLVSTLGISEKEPPGKRSFFDAGIAKMEEMAGIRETIKKIAKLEKSGNAAAVGSLRELLKDDNGHVRKAASESLERLLKKANYPDVDAALGDSSSGDQVKRVGKAATIFAENTRTMAFDGKVLSRRVDSKTAPTVPDFPGKSKTRT